MVDKDRGRIPDLYQDYFAVSAKELLGEPMVNPDNSLDRYKAERTAGYKADIYKTKSTYSDVDTKITPRAIKAVLLR